MDSPDTPLRLTDRKRAAILQAAIAEFRSDGYEATSMDRIAARAGVSKRTVYNHFVSKEALFTAILDGLMQTSEAGFDKPYRADEPLRLQLLALLDAKMRLLHEPEFQDLARVAIAAGALSPDLARTIVEQLGKREAGVAVWVRDAAADGRIETGDPLFAALQLESLIKGFAFWPQIAMGQPPLSETEQRRVLEGAVDLFLARYAA
ncbi:TetR/AcrR family transcriptional regulator [Chitinasiproducens palmae]|uniref:Transcriptional regulator, TetR family n=1 Tax=Chitinasiproducens palmae TaxID=1770053 RepID=A0A1H2PU13_9BURK|nr:TetR/AcrR family transcriptional regulator [Chitinasiproducens palmae]SDV50642.1 transcriptional regulator, TetR family [Chitinasiproducens palmae]